MKNFLLFSCLLLNILSLHPAEVKSSKKNALKEALFAEPDYDKDLEVWLDAKLAEAEDSEEDEEGAQQDAIDNHLEALSVATATTIIAPKLSGILNNFIQLHGLLKRNLAAEEPDAKLLMKCFANFQTQLKELIDLIEAATAMLGLDKVPEDNTVLCHMIQMILVPNNGDILVDIQQIIIFNADELLKIIKDENLIAKINEIKKDCFAKLTIISNLSSTLARKIKQNNSDFNNVMKELVKNPAESLQVLLEKPNEKKESSKQKKQEQKKETKPEVKLTEKQKEALKRQLTSKIFDSEKPQAAKSKTKKKKKTKKDKKSKASAQQQQEPKQQAQQPEQRPTRQVEVEKKVKLEDKAKVFSDLYNAIKNYELDKVSESIKLIQQNGLNINELHEETTALHVAAEWGNPQATALLMEAGADGSIYNDEGFTALHLAASNGCIFIAHKDCQEKVASKNLNITSFEDFTKIVKIIISKQWQDKSKPKVYQLVTQGKKRNILHLSCLYGNQATVELCLGYCPIDVKDTDGFEPIHLSVFSQNKKIIPILLSGKANINAKDSNGNTPLHLACYKDEYYWSAKELVLNHADVNPVNAKGSNPAQVAGIFGCARAIILLQRNKADLASKSPLGKSAAEHYQEVAGHINTNNLIDDQRSEYLKGLRQKFGKLVIL